MSIFNFSSFKTERRVVRQNMVSFVETRVKHGQLGLIGGLLPATNVIITPQHLLRERLSAVDWNFLDSNNQQSIHSIHPYPAKFIPEIPRTVIQQLGIAPGTSLLDPFCGSGVSLVEAQRFKIPSIGLDLNPIACLISKVKTRPLPARFRMMGNKIAITASTRRRRLDRNIPNVNHWFLFQVQDALHALLSEIEEVEPEDLQDALKLAVSSIIVRVSNQDSDTRYAAVKKKVSFERVIELFLAACQQFVDVLSPSASDFLLPSKVLCCDSLNSGVLLKGRSIGLIITSPPYPNAYEYWLYHKYRMWWLGLDPLAVKEKEIGARAHFFKKNAHTAEHFRDQMMNLFACLSPLTINETRWAFVVGSSKIHGKLVDNAKIISDVGLAFGWNTAQRLERRILQSRKAFNLSHARIKEESIVILER